MGVLYVFPELRIAFKSDSLGRASIGEETKAGMQQVQIPFLDVRESLCEPAFGGGSA
jgi:hypothetical protein